MIILMLPTAQACQISYKNETTNKIDIKQETQINNHVNIQTTMVTRDSTKQPLLQFWGTTDSITWNETVHKFEGSVPTGPPASFKFIFTNHGDRPAKIKSVEAACSCTASEYSREEILPGKTGWVSAAYKTANTFGYFNKHIDVQFEGSDKTYRLYLTGTVNPYDTGDKK